MGALRRLLLVSGTLALGLTGACDRKATGEGTESAANGDPAAVPDTASDQGARLARRIVKALTLEEAVAGTREALIRGGLTVSDLSGSTPPTVGASSPFIVLPPEAVLLAFEARRHATHSRLTLDELGGMWADFGWPFSGEGMPGDQLMRIIAAWVREARRAPNDSLNFTPLFLADMGRRQIPAVDLASDSTDPGEVRLGFLEVQLLASELTRGLDEAIVVGRDTRASIFPASYRASQAGPDACAEAKAWFGKTIPGKAAGSITKWAVKGSLKQVLEAAGISKENVKVVSQALSAVSTGMKIVKLGQLYGTTAIDMDYGSNVPAHRPGPDGEEFTSVIARAGIDPQELREYQESLKSSELAVDVRNCLASMGLPTWSDLADVAKDAEKWRVRWVLGRGSPKHAVHIIDKNVWYLAGNRIMQLTRASPTSAEAKYTFKLTPEEVGGHPGPKLKGQVEVTAELQTSKPPSPSFISSMISDPVIGLIHALVELGVGWFQTVVTPKATLMVPVVYHQPGINILIEDKNQVVLDFRGKNRLWVIGGMTAERSDHVYYGSIHLGEDSLWHGQVRTIIHGTYTALDSAAVARRMSKYAHLTPENASFEDLIRAWANIVETLGDLPTCRGSYQGVQFFAVEGQFITGDEGQQQVELAIYPAGSPEFYDETPSCPWVGLEEIDGTKAIPARIPKGQETAITIDAPKKGERRVYRDVVNMKGIYGSTTITVGAE